MAQVEIAALEKHYGDYYALKGVNITVEDGEFVVLVGPSGCGKSTLLRSIAGLEDVTSGTIRIGGEDVTDLEPRDRDIAMVFQSYALYPHMTVRDNMAFSLELQNIPKAETEARVGEAARILGIETLLDRKPRALSGGQRQRVAMGRAIVRHPKVFLFDEPLSNLDAKLRVQMRAEIRALHDRLGATSVYVTHDQVEAMTMADRIVVLEAGQIVQVGSPLELYNHPVNRFVAEFIGSPSINILTGEIRDHQLILSGAEMALPIARDLPDGPVEIGVRPEDLMPDSNGQVRGRISLIEHLGAESYIVFNSEAGLGNRALYWRAPGTPDIAAPADIRLGFNPAMLHYFDPQTGRKL